MIALRTLKPQAQATRCRNCEISPSSTHLHKRKPPGPVFARIFIQIEIEDIQERIIWKRVDRNLAYAGSVNVFGTNTRNEIAGNAIEP